MGGWKIKESKRFIQIDINPPFVFAQHESRASGQILSSNNRDFELMARRATKRQAEPPVAVRSDRKLPQLPNTIPSGLTTLTKYATTYWLSFAVGQSVLRGRLSVMNKIHTELYNFGTINIPY